MSASRELPKKPRPKNEFPPLRLALSTIALLSCFVFLPPVEANPQLTRSILGASGALLLLLLILSREAARTGRALFYEFLPKPSHYVQLATQSLVYAYWGWYWRAVYQQIPLIAAQVLFFYAFDMLVCWFRRDRWILGFGAFPIVLATNLFLCFKPDWFFLQFLMLATGVLCKEFFTWERDGRRTHIFNPAAVALFIFSLALILTRSTGISYAPEIAVSFEKPPFIIAGIFLLGLVVQARFAVTLVTLSAVAVLYALNLAYTGATSLYFFGDSNITASVFLGMHLLVTDPATSPRTGLGKALFGAMYGAAVFALYRALPLDLSFYDKLLCVPLLNLTVRALDRAGVGCASAWPVPSWRPERANHAAMAVWIGLFTVMMATGFLTGPHPGAYPDFWRKACSAGRPTACRQWVSMMNAACEANSRAACMDLGAAVLSEGGPLPRDSVKAAKAFAHVCDLGLPDGCAALIRIVEQDAGGFLQTACDKGDSESCFFLGSMYLAGKGLRKDASRGIALLSRSCSDGWWRGCTGLGECYRFGNGTAIDNALALQNFDKACSGGMAISCFHGAEIYGAFRHDAEARTRLRRGCELISLNTKSSLAYVRGDAAVQNIQLPAVCARVF